MAGDTNRKGKPFEVKDCTLITRMGGVEPALNLRELRERIKICPIESLYHHFCETVIRPSFDDPEFRNDFAVWAAHSMHDRLSQGVVLDHRMKLYNSRHGLSGRISLPSHGGYFTR